MTKLKDKKIKINKKSLTENVIDNDSLKPIFSFSEIQEGFNFKNRKDITPDHLQSFLSKIETLSNLTWLEIKKLPREKGIEKINNIKKKAKNITDDVPLYSIRFGDKERIIGYREKNIFSILFVDIKHELYD